MSASTRFPGFSALVESLPSTVPFIGPEAIERRRKRHFKARLGANENGFGPAPSVIAAIGRSARDVWKYGDPECALLRSDLADHLGIATDNIVIGEGIDALLGLAVRLVTSPGTDIVTSKGAYPTFAYHAAGFGARLHQVPYRDDREDLEGLLNEVQRTDAKMVYLANPDNPMGSWWSGRHIAEFVEAVPSSAMIVLDEAYCETMPDGDLPLIAVDRPNVIRMRTFSKSYGLAGLRCGYAFGEAQTIAVFNRVRNHFGVNAMAQIAARAALEDQAYLLEVTARIESARERIACLAQDCGLLPLASATNFVAVDCGGDGAFADTILQNLTDRDIFLRKPNVSPQDRCIRISVGPDDQLALLEDALPEAVAAARN